LIEFAACVRRMYARANVFWCPIICRSSSF
jgi:hypothetical protein